MEDLEQRMKMFVKSTYWQGQEEEEEEDVCGGDTFAERAEWFFQKRPQLLSLLQDLYNRYASLLDRINHYHTQCNSPPAAAAGIDEMIAHLVMKNVEEDILMDQVREMENQFQESSTKIDLLKKLLEVLESERIVLSNENARLGYKMAAVLEENKSLSSQAMFLNRRAAYLARCVLKMREDHRVFMLNRKIEDLQAQIYGLEKRNDQYYQQLRMKEKQEIRRNIKNGKLGCFQFKKKNEEEASTRTPNWWDRAKKAIEWPMCGPGQNSTRYY